MNTRQAQVASNESELLLFACSTNEAASLGAHWGVILNTVREALRSTEKQLGPPNPPDSLAIRRGNFLHGVALQGKRIA